MQVTVNCNLFRNPALSPIQAVDSVIAAPTKRDSTPQYYMGLHALLEFYIHQYPCPNAAPQSRRYCQTGDRAMPAYCMKRPVSERE